MEPIVIDFGSLVGYSHTWSANNNASLVLLTQEANLEIRFVGFVTFQIFYFVRVMEKKLLFFFF